jgi:hypothetical protein
MIPLQRAPRSLYLAMNFIISAYRATGMRKPRHRIILLIHILRRSVLISPSSDTLQSRRNNAKRVSLPSVSNIARHAR